MTTTRVGTVDEASPPPTPAPGVGRPHDVDPGAALAGFASHLGSVQTLSALLDALAGAALRLLRADSVHIGRLDHQHGRLHVLRNAGVLSAWESEAPTDEWYLIADYPQLMHTLERALPWRGSATDPTTSAHDRQILDELGKAHALSVPLTSAGAVWGELYCTRADAPSPAEPSPGAFTVGDEHLAVVLSTMAETALLRLHGDQRLRELAYADPLTGLANRRALDEQLDTWMTDPAVASSVTVVLCDVNGLKAVNDGYGHLVGDRHLRDVGGHVSAAAGSCRTEWPPGSAATSS
jgi:GAF domain-containing protein